MSHYYSYAELRAAATAPGATQADIDALGEWFSRYGDRYWNGECYDAEGFEVVPKYQQIGEDEFEIVGYELR